MPVKRFKFFSSVIFWICFSFVIWIFAFFGFLTSKLALIEDSLSYYEHTKFYVENLLKGVFPLWDPFWSNGASNDFFLRRIGAFNPFYLIIGFFESVGISYTLAYLWFLALYYWSGMIAFYLLARRMYDSQLIAYAGYLILLFSSLGTRIFDSYMMLVTVPLLWFFYFLVAFTQTPRKHFFFGMCLFFIILASTYIPFYFFCCLVVFIVFFVFFYFQRIPHLIRSYFHFFKGNKILIILSLGFVFFSFAPLLNFFHNSNKGEIVLPARHGSSALGQTLVVPSTTLDWGVVEDLMFSTYFTDWRTIRFAVIYIPFFAFIVFFFGLFGPITRRAVFMFTCGFVLLCCLIPRGLPFHGFLYDHVFFLKYFRNLHFFLWFALIPLFVMLILEHWRIFTNIKSNQFLTQTKLLIFVVLVHLMAFIVIFLRGDAILSTYGMLILSAFFWVLLFLGRLSNPMWAFVFLTLTVIIQPLEVYHYLSARAKVYTDNMYGYHFSFTSVKIKEKEVAPPLKGKAPLKKGSLYYSSGNYNVVFQNTSDYALAKYLQYKFILVDHLELMDSHQVAFTDLEKIFLNNDNKAFIFKQNASELKLNSNNPHPALNAQRIAKEGDDFKVISFDANHLKLAIEIPYEKFLIYNDSYSSEWKSLINGKSVRCYQTNVAFKGVWVPAGYNIIEFKYGSWWQYAMNIVLIIGSFLFLIGILYFSLKSSKLKES